MKERTLEKWLWIIAWAVGTLLSVAVYSAQVDNVRTDTAQQIQEERQIRRINDALRVQRYQYLIQIARYRHQCFMDVVEIAKQRDRCKGARERGMFGVEHGEKSNWR